MKELTSFIHLWVQRETKETKLQETLDKESQRRKLSTRWAAFQTLWTELVTKYIHFFPSCYLCLLRAVVKHQFPYSSTWWRQSCRNRSVSILLSESGGRTWHQNFLKSGGSHTSLLSVVKEWNVKKTQVYTSHVCNNWFTTLIFATTELAKVQWLLNLLWHLHDSI